MWRFLILLVAMVGWLIVTAATFAALGFIAIIAHVW